MENLSGLVSLRLPQLWGFENPVMYGLNVSLPASGVGVGFICMQAPLMPVLFDLLKLQVNAHQVA